MNLIKSQIPATPAITRYRCSGNYNLSAGKTLIIETSPSGQDILSEEVPAGKRWQVTIDVSVIETEV